MCILNDSADLRTKQTFIHQKEMIMGQLFVTTKVMSHSNENVHYEEFIKSKNFILDFN